MNKKIKKTVLLAFMSVILTIISLFAVNGEGMMDYSEKAPGGTVTNVKELITALGKDSFGNPNAQLMLNSDNQVRLINSVILENPLIIKDGTYFIIGGGCMITRGFENGSVIIVDGSDESKNPVLNFDRRLEIDDEIGTESNLIIDGNIKQFPETKDAFVKVTGKGKFISNNKVLYKNINSTGKGGAICGEYVKAGDKELYPIIEIYKNDFENCKAKDGGAIYFSSSKAEKPKKPEGENVPEQKPLFKGTLEIVKSNFVKCSASENGGAIYTRGGNVTLNEIKAEENTAKNGGAFHITSMAQLTGVNFKGNYSNEDGSCIYCGANEEFACEMGIINLVANDNRALRDGGVIYNKGITIIGSVYMQDNSAGRNGGAICNVSSFAITEASITTNKCDGLGGGFYNGTSNSILLMSGGEILTNTAKYGGGLYSEGVFQMTGGSIGNNRGGIPQVIIKNEFIMGGAASVYNKNIIGLCKDDKGNFPLIEIDSKLKSKAEQQVAFFNEENGKYVIASENGMKVFKGSSENIASALSVFTVYGTALKGFNITKDGILKAKPPLMPIWAWILSVIGVIVLGVGIFLFIKFVLPKIKAKLLAMKEAKENNEETDENEIKGKSEDSENKEE